MLGRPICILIERPLGSRHPKYGFIYPVNYGYVPGTISGDGEALDAYLLGIHQPVDTYTGQVIAVIHRLDDDDDKLVLAPEGMSYSDEDIRALTAFQEQWFTSVIIRQAGYELNSG
ncbi:MAG: inorganic diphosphatase [Anaerolineae bacterium]|nr:inorganic diphosphatase [Anaerolineae bacterium]